MPLRRRSSSGILNPNLTPLLDVVLQLITFFMMLVHFGTRLEGASKAVRLPLAPAALPGSDLTFDRLSVVLDARGRLQSGNQWLGEDAAAIWWAGQARARKAGRELLKDPSAADDELPTIVIVRADRAASYGAVRRTLATAQEQGFAHFSLVVVRRRGTR
jgi:biopolymer transport protein ExbD